MGRGLGWWCTQVGMGAWGGKGAGGALVQVPSKEVRAGKLGHEGWGAVGGRPE